jgi:long-chain acyl-CoA synthetase
MVEQFVYPEIPFHQLLHQTAERLPDKTAIVFRGQRISFGELDRAASRLAHGLLRAGLRKGDRIALFMPNCPEYAVGFFGACRAGLIPTPLNPSYKEREVRCQIEESGAAALIVHGNLWPVVAPIRADLTTLRIIAVLAESPPSGCLTFADLQRAQPASMPTVAIAMDDICVLPFSSGTTGTAKGVMLTQRNVVCNAEQFATATRTTDVDVLLIFLPLYHIYGIALIAFAISRGATVVLMERFDLAESIRLTAAENVTQWYVVPPVMLTLINTPNLGPDDFRPVRFMMSAAAPLPPEIARRVRERLNVPIIQAYGLTETSPLTHIVPIDEADAALGTCGKVAASTRCRIVDLTTGERELPAGEVGEVTIAGPQVMAGYWNAPDETARTLRAGWLHSGDVGRLDEHGNLLIVDRKKEMIKYKAFSIAPAELESVLLEHPAVLDCAVCPQPDEEAGEVPCAFVVLRPGIETTAADLQDFVAARVASYKQIKSLHFVDAIPRTPSGKILRRLLTERAAGNV